MTRVLLTLTVLLGGALFGAPLQAAASNFIPALAVPQLKISGSTSFNTWFFNNNKKFVPGNTDDAPASRSAYGRGQFFTMDDARLKFAADGKTDRGMEYGLVLVLDGDTNGTKTLRENYLFFGGTWGKLLLGDTYGVQSTMAFDGADQWGGTGFMNANFDRVVNFTTGTLHSIYFVGDTNRDTKATYLTPRWYGFQAGVSYTPRSEHRGENNMDSIKSYASNKKPFDTDNISSGINFIHKFCNGFEMALSATSAFAKSHPEFLGAPKRKNIASYAFGGTFYYANVGFSAEYANSGNSRELAGQSLSNAGQFVDFGLSYTWGATKFSTGYYYGWRNALGGNSPTYYGTGTLGTNLTRVKSTTSAVSAAIDHKLAPGLGIYFEYANFQMKNPAAIAEANRFNILLAPGNAFTPPIPTNRANAFVVGSRLVF